MKLRKVTTLMIEQVGRTCVTKIARQIRLFFFNLTYKFLAGINGRKISAREIKMVDVHQPI